MEKPELLELKDKYIFWCGDKTYFFPKARYGTLTVSEICDKVIVQNGLDEKYKRILEKRDIEILEKK